MRYKRDMIANILNQIKINLYSHKQLTYKNASTMYESAKALSKK